MSTTLYLTYVLTVLVVMASPGPATILAFSHGLRHGGARTLATIAGDLFANQLQMVLAVTGLGLILAASHTAFVVLKVVGVLYIAYLAIKTLRSGKAGSEYLFAGAKEKMPLGRHFREGFTVSFTSPKAIAFYGALFPHFINPSNDLLPQFVLLAITAAVIDFFFLCIYAFGAERAGSKLVARFGSTAIRRFSGAMLLVAAGILALAEPPEARVGG